MRRLRGATRKFLHSNGFRLGEAFEPVTRPYLRLLPFVIVLSLLASLLEGLGIGMLIPLVALILSENATLATSAPEPIRTIAAAVIALAPQNRLLTLGAAMIFLVIMRGFVQSANNILISNIDMLIGRDIRNALSAKILTLDYPFFLQNNPERIIQIISADSWAVSGAVRSAMMVLPALTNLTVFTAILLWLDWRLSLIVLIGGILILITLQWLESLQKKISLLATAQNHTLGIRMLGIVHAMRAIRIFGQQRREQIMFETASGHVSHSMFKARRLAALVLPMVDIFVALMFVIIILAAYAFHISVPEVTAYLVLLSRAQPHAHTISQSRTGIASVQGSLDEVRWLLSQKTMLMAPDEASLPMQKQAIPFQGDGPLKFDDVSYTFPGSSHPAVENLDFSLEPGTVTALIGQSGSGKTTIANLICRLVEPDEGAIYLGNQPIRKLDVDIWRRHLAIAGQDIDLMNGTIADNISYGMPDASAAEIEEAADAAGASGFIARIPQQYQAHVGQGGLQLSGGQRQRIGLARALLRRPDLLILDEATNAVDAISEQEIMRILNERQHFRTALVISHRRSTLTACDKGIVISQGRIIEAGPLAGLNYYRTMAGEIS